MSLSSDAVYVFRHHGPHYGRRCRIVAVTPLASDVRGVPIHHVGSEAVALEFEDGTRIEAQRQQVICVGSALARRVEAKAKRGGTRMRDHRNGWGA